MTKTRFILILSQILCTFAKGTLAKTLTVVELEPNTWDYYSFNDTYNINDDFLQTKELTICFRYMARFNRDYYVIVETHQLKLLIANDNSYVYLRSLNASTTNDEYRRILTYCKSYTPGHWMSMCLRIKLSENTQEILFYQNGNPCSEERYFDGDFEWIYFQKKLSLNDLLR